MALCDCLCFNTVAVFIGIATLLYFYIKKSYQYWSNKNIPYIDPRLLLGNFPNPLTTKRHIGLIIKDYYDDMKQKGHRHFGMYFWLRPIYTPIALDEVKNILTKDFQHFVDRGTFYNERDDPLSAHLFAIGGVKWRNLRMKLTPTFTSGKMRGMFQTLVHSGVFMEKAMDKLHEEKQAVDIKEILGCFTTDIIGSCAFGLECNSFTEPDSPFRRYGKKIFQSTLWRRIVVSLGINFPKFGKLVGLKFVEKDVSDFFMKIVRDAIAYRTKNNIVRKDFLQLLIELMKKDDDGNYAHDGKSLTFEEVAAQSFVFFIAGFETSSTTMTFALFELAQNQDIQEKVRSEVNEVLKRYNGEITYDAINDMKYMSQVIDETLRKYPPLAFITRQCVKDYKIPGEDTILETGTRVFIPILGIHYDKEHYREPEKFDPERFSEENSQKRHQYAHIPFGEGPRMCIGMRFGIMQSKVGLTVLLKNYRFTLNTKTQLPLELNNKSFILAAKGDIWLNIEKIK
uniref:Cytochrome P450 CYP6BK18 n=1 Tax=Dastarcus helophoroides TaxID=1169899 RepID=M9THW1_9CUCU|nr:cytochrome P450 CYP6BK18 [Dastarcus helophoroides]